MQICAPRCGDDSRVVDAPKRLKFLSYTAYGLRIGLEASFDLLPFLPSPLIPGAEHVAELDMPGSPLTCFQFQRARSENGFSAFRVAGNGSDVFLSSDIGMAARTLESRIHQYVAASTEAAVFVHAGVVGWRGRAVVIPGPSQSGKSTLVAALVSEGATYYSDEYAVIDLDGRVHAFPREIRLRPDILGKQIATAPKLGDSGPLDPLPLGWVLNIRHNPAGTWQPEALTPGRTLLALLENTVAVRRQSELTIKTLKSALVRAIGFQAERAEAASAARAILLLLER
jgi:hypothetical protein